MNIDFEAVQTSIHRALIKIGNTNGHACPTGGSNLDPLYHDLLVSHTAKAYFDSIYKKRLESLKDIYEDEIAAAKVGHDTLIGVGHHYLVHLNLSKPASMMDQKKFVSELRKAGVSSDVITKATAAATKDKAGAKRFSVTGRV